MKTIDYGIDREEIIISTGNFMKNGTKMSGVTGKDYMNIIMKMVKLRIDVFIKTTILTA
jgi:hypothetical protein